MSEIIMLSLDELTPYEKNPRKNDQSVQAVANSIKEFGFKKPIIVDRGFTIIAGHTRYKAFGKVLVPDHRDERGNIVYKFNNTVSIPIVPQ